jgi:16S rRNA (cytidine1402-2'-O)-methyltransferase
MNSSATSRLGGLYLIPTTLGDVEIDSSLPPRINSLVARLSYFVVEEEKTARHFIKKVCPDRVIREINIRSLNEHTSREEVAPLLNPLREGHDIGLISEAGCPAIADPGADLVRLAHELGAQVHPLVGPCSMILALMASGFNGQRWRFVGYLPIEDDERRKTIGQIERDLYTSNETQIVMDTPYRNQRLFEELLSTCRPETKICVASALTTDTESIRVFTVKDWKALGTTIGKVPTIFVLGR